MKNTVLIIILAFLCSCSSKYIGVHSSSIAAKHPQILSLLKDNTYTWGNKFSSIIEKGKWQEVEDNIILLLPFDMKIKPRFAKIDREAFQKLMFAEDMRLLTSEKEKALWERYRKNQMKVAQYFIYRYKPENEMCSFLIIDPESFREEIGQEFKIIAEQTHNKILRDRSMKEIMALTIQASSSIGPAKIFQKRD